jgi:FtsZ-interacting cell division protein YlmF
MEKSRGLKLLAAVMALSILNSHWFINHAAIAQNDNTEQTESEENSLGKEEAEETETEEDMTENEELTTETAEEEAKQLEQYNPLNEMNALTDREFWRNLQGSLPCLKYESSCVIALQNLAVSKSPLLSSIDQKLEAIKEAINNAETINNEDKKLAVLKPALVFLATPETVQITNDKNQITTERRGILDRVISIVTSPANLINDLVGAVAKPLADYLTGGSQEYKQSTIAIAGLNAEAANLRIDRQKLELEVRRIIDERLAEVDNSAREYRLTLAAIATLRREAELYKLGFTRGIGNMQTMINLESSIQNTASQVISKFNSLRTNVNRLKFLAYGGSPIDE